VYVDVYRGPDLEINKSKQTVRIKGIVRLKSEQLQRFYIETNRVYYQAMGMEYNEQAQEEINKKHREELEQGK